MGKIADERQEFFIKEIYKFKYKYEFENFGKASHIFVVDKNKIRKINKHLVKFAWMMHFSLPDEYRQRDCSDMFRRIKRTLIIMLNSGIIEKMNNNGRDKHAVYFNWGKGFVIAEIFRGYIAAIFNVKENMIINIGADNCDKFRKKATADLAILPFEHRVEVQCGFNNKFADIKKHKIEEAGKQENDSFCIHISISDGKVAIIPLKDLLNRADFVSRSEFEGKDVYEISKDDFKWSFENPPIFKNNSFIDRGLK
jgi:hypothetical protein